MTTTSTILEEIDSIKIKKEDQEAVARIAAAKARIKEVSKDVLGFPLQSLPVPLQNIIKVFNECYQLPVDFYAASALVAASTLIGNKYVVEYKYKWEYSPILYCAIVGEPGLGKTPAMKAMLKPLIEIEKQYNEEYLQDIETWKQECFERTLTGAKTKEPTKPKAKEIIINDATLEAINSSLNNNPRGLLYFRDELTGWLNSMNQYRKGSDNEFWLSTWNNTSIKINRQGKDPLFIKQPFINVIGGIQPGVLHNMVSNNKAESGFLARILFAYPDDMKKPYDSDHKPDHSVYDHYEKILHKLNELPSNIRPPESEYHNWTVESVKVKLSDGGLKKYKKFLRNNTDLINSLDDETIKGIYVKMESYCLRFALILQMIDAACSDQELSIEDIENMTIDESWIDKAIKLIEYFKRTAVKVITRFDTPVNKLPIEKKVFYEEGLPEEFSTKEAVRIGRELNLSERTVKRLLGDTSIFRRVKQGYYQKLFI